MLASVMAWRPLESGRFARSTLSLLSLLYLTIYHSTFHFPILPLQEKFSDVEEKYKEAMVSSAQLYNEKTALVFQVESLRDRSEVTLLMTIMYTELVLYTCIYNGTECVRCIECNRTALNKGHTSFSLMNLPIQFLPPKRGRNYSY